MIKAKTKLWKQYFWRGLYRTLIDIQVFAHRVDLWIYRKIDYQFFVKNDIDPVHLIGISRQPFRARR